MKFKVGDRVIINNDNDPRFENQVGIVTTTVHNDLWPYTVLWESMPPGSSKKWLHKEKALKLYKNKLILDRLSSWVK